MFEGCNIEMTFNIVAVVVTYNRKDLLKECLSALLGQSIQLEKIVVIDNASTDGTSELFEKNQLFDINTICYKAMDSNLGGAAGFNEGIKHAYSVGADWIWIMDDDTIPTRNALEGLCKSLENISSQISFLASTVVGKNGEPMNVPAVDLDQTENGYSDWYLKLPQKLIKIKSATFVSLLINSRAIEKIGYPVKWYFIWGDDTEYTQRLVKFYGPAYLTGESVVIHKRFNTKSISIENEENYTRINNYYYYYRNLLINLNEYSSKMNVLKNIVKYNILCIKMLFYIKSCKYKLKKIYIIQKGIAAFIFKAYDNKDFNNRFKIKD